MKKPLSTAHPITLTECALFSFNNLDPNIIQTPPPVPEFNVTPSAKEAV